MVLAAASHNIAASLYPKLAYDPLKDFTPLAHIGTASYVLMIHPSIPARTVAEYIAYAKANPGKLNYATAGNGSATHLSMAYFNGLAGIDVVHVPLKATGEAINEVISGRAHAVIAASIGALAFANDSRLRLLGSTSPNEANSCRRFLPSLRAGYPGTSLIPGSGCWGRRASRQLRRTGSMPPSDNCCAILRFWSDSIVRALSPGRCRTQSSPDCWQRTLSGWRQW